ncbi:hypothetical protein [uncultured Bacteroides sp.]|uniref:hypothetical protein n=1 Tax=uncultured Bacteroides sp. TaxID=162156 RepID=UPI002AABB1CA|nr:hypothetical protein [uncultured Bacteroides sp.]
MIVEYQFINKENDKVNIDNFIIIKGGLCNDIKKALQQWITLYSKDLVSNIKLELYILGLERYLIVADKRLNNEKFNYLINYLRYPEGIEYNISIEGYATVSDGKIYPQNLLHKNILVYVPDNDKEFDNVFVTTEDNETYKIDFGGKVSRVYESRTFRIPDIDTNLLQKPERIALTKLEITEVENEKSKKSIKNRFRIILALVIIIAAINSFFLFIYPNNDISSITTYILVFFVALWFDWDYKMLRIDKYYSYSIIIALLHLAYGHFIRKYLSEEDSFLYYGFYFPVLYLIIQKPVRLFFIRKFNREPIIEPHPPLLDGLYGITILFLTVGIISIIAMFA